MKKIIIGLGLVLLAIFLVACGGESVTVIDQPPVAPPPGPPPVVIPPQNLVGGIIFFNDNNHVLKFDLSDNTVKGMVWDNVISPDMVKSVSFYGDRVGWFEKSIAVANFDPSGHVMIPNTANNDTGIWNLLLKNGKIVSFNTEKWDRDPSVRSEITSDGLVRYGSYKPATISFIAPDNVLMDFGSNVISGFLSPINPADVAFFRWNSNETGWAPNGSAQGTLEVDPSGNYIVRFTGMPLKSKGNFSVHLKDGTTVVWMDVTTWNVSGNCTIDLAAGQIEYRMNP